MVVFVDEVVTDSDDVLVVIVAWELRAGFLDRNDIGIATVPIVRIVGDIVGFPGNR